MSQSISGLPPWAGIEASGVDQIPTGAMNSWNSTPVRVHGDIPLGDGRYANIEDSSAHVGSPAKERPTLASLQQQRRPVQGPLHESVEVETVDVHSLMQLGQQVHHNLNYAIESRR